MQWKSKVYSTAFEIANKFKEYPNVVGIAIGGSIGRGETWKHSDLELCIIVQEIIDTFQYFNVIDQMGVEIIQIPLNQVEKFISQFQHPDPFILKFPIQVYKCKIIHDPTNVLTKFKDLYDKYLFHEEITKLKTDEALASSDNRLFKTKDLLAKGNYRTALAHLRLGLNDLLLAYYWHYHILPRSQNRTIYLLSKNSKIIGHNKLNQAFLECFCLTNPVKKMKERLLLAQHDIYQTSVGIWGSNAPEFLHKAVDSQLEWGHSTSTLYIYKWCSHILHCSDINVEDIYDHPDFRLQYENLYTFLDFNDLNIVQVENMIKLYEEARTSI